MNEKNEKKYPDQDWNGWELCYCSTTFELRKDFQYISLFVAISYGWDWTVDHVNGMIANGKLHLF